jgi:hypothetical protein
VAAWVISTAPLFFFYRIKAVDLGAEAWYQRLMENKVSLQVDPNSRDLTFGTSVPSKEERVDQYKGAVRRLINRSVARANAIPEANRRGSRRTSKDGEAAALYVKQLQRSLLLLNIWEIGTLGKEVEPCLVTRENAVAFANWLISSGEPDRGVWSARAKWKVGSTERELFELVYSKKTVQMTDVRLGVERERLMAAARNLIIGKAARSSPTWNELRGTVGASGSNIRRSFSSVRLFSDNRESLRRDFVNGVEGDGKGRKCWTISSHKA